MINIPCRTNIFILHYCTVHCTPAAAAPRNRVRGYVLYENKNLAAKRLPHRFQGRLVRRRAFQRLEQAIVVCSAVGPEGCGVPRA